MKVFRSSRPSSARSLARAKSCFTLYSPDFNDVHHITFADAFTFGEIQSLLFFRCSLFWTTFFHQGLICFWYLSRSRRIKVKVTRTVEYFSVLFCHISISRSVVLVAVTKVGTILSWLKGRASHHTSVCYLRTSHTYDSETLILNEVLLILPTGQAAQNSLFWDQMLPAPFLQTFLDCYTFPRHPNCKCPDTLYKYRACSKSQCPENHLG